MPEYDYKCDKCNIIIAATHKMSESPSILCSKCNSKMHKTFENTRLQTWVRGDGLVKDVAGAKREMDLCKLQMDDPYAEHRVIGEKSYLEDKLKRAGKKKEAATGTPRWIMVDGKLTPINQDAAEYDNNAKHHLK